MTTFRKVEPHQLLRDGFFDCECKPGEHQLLQFTIGGYQPEITNAFTPPAENIHAHNVIGRPGYDPRCKPADPVPARFSAICSNCGQGWFYEASEEDLRISPEQIVLALAKRLDAQLKEAIPNPALRVAVGSHIERHAQQLLRELGLPALLAEIPARGASKAQEEFCARFMLE